MNNFLPIVVNLKKTIEEYYNLGSVRENMQTYGVRAFRFQ